MNISEWNQQQTTIGHLKVRSTGSQEDISKTVLRLRVEQLLSNADLHPPGLGTGAVLIVHKLDTPAPVEVSTPSQPLQVGWLELLRSQVATLYATAVRPALEAVPLDASSVLFADPGEMLTCLTRDLLSGQAHERWYWQQVLRNVPRTPGTALPMLWCEQATFIPTVLASLRPAEMFSVITHLTPLAVKQIIHSLHTSFDLPPGIFTDIASTESEGSSSTRVVTGDLPVDKEPVVSSPPAASRPPWEQWLPDASLPALSSQALYLLGLGLALYHAPAFARSTRFASQAAHWLQAEREKRSYTPDHARSLSESSPTAETSKQKTNPPTQSNTGFVSLPMEEEQGHTRSNNIDVSRALERREEQPPLAHHSNNDNSPGAPASQPSASSTGQHEHSEELVALPSQGSPTSSSQAMQVSLEQALPVSSSQAARPPLFPALTRPTTPDTPGAAETQEFVPDTSKSLPADGVPTRLGGVLYLINLLTWLNLPHSWDNDGTLAEHMSGWAIIEALARGLLGDLHEQHIHDPVWHALAILDGRELGASIATGGMLMDEDKSFRLPASWLRRYGSATWSALQEEERLLLYDDSAGFLIVDVPLRDRSFFEVTHAEVKAYCDQGLEVSWHLGFPEAFQKVSSGGLTSTSAINVSPLIAEKRTSTFLDEDVLSWLGRVLGFVSYLLARALGESLDEPTRLAELLLCRHGQLIVSRTHVDLHMSMEEISIAVRRVGLDRDPGWVPDLARIVYFHFD